MSYGCDVPTKIFMILEKLHNLKLEITQVATVQSESFKLLTYKLYYILCYKVTRCTKQVIWSKQASHFHSSWVEKWIEFQQKVYVFYGVDLYLYKMDDVIKLLLVTNFVQCLFLLKLVTYIYYSLISYSHLFCLYDVYAYWWVTRSV